LSRELEFDIQEELELEEPKKYKVMLLNDDYSTMDFVIEILTTIFKKTQDEATAIMLKVHKNGKAVCGVYIHEIAATKVAQVKANARKAQFPLKAILEEE
jgi:ATP-dependent Clp protease adaptor protein ClpS